MQKFLKFIYKILQYFIKKENKYKKIADKIYIHVLDESKIIISKNFFKKIDFDSSFEIISIILIFYFKVFKDKSEIKYKNINDLLIKNLIEDFDQTMREIGIGDMSLGKHVKKYIKKFYYRIKLIDQIFSNYNEDNFISYLNSLNNINTDYTKNLALDFKLLYEKIKKNKDFI